MHKLEGADKESGERGYLLNGDSDFEAADDEALPLPAGVPSSVKPYGLAGDIVRRILPETEADSVGAASCTCSSPLEV